MVASISEKEATIDRDRITMGNIKVTFEYITGITRKPFTNVYLLGSWDEDGRYSNQWTEQSMEYFIYSDGSTAYRQVIELEDTQKGWDFHWGVLVDSPEVKHIWGIPCEIKRSDSTKRFQSFTLGENDCLVQYFLSHNFRLGANKHYDKAGEKPGIRFSLWAPNAREVRLIFGHPESGYISDNGEGIDPFHGEIPMTEEQEGIWSVDKSSYPLFSDYNAFVDKFYMFKILTPEGSWVYRTDIYSRRQAGSGSTNPEGGLYKGNPKGLKKSISCSVVVDPGKNFSQKNPLPPPKLKDLIIYELNTGALGFGKQSPGSLEDAIEMIPYLKELGITAVELLPLNGMTDGESALSHYCTIETGSSGRNNLKEFISLCHENSIYVIMDLSFYYLPRNSKRSYWQYDSLAEENNIYFWYEGNAADYPSDEQGHHGGYITNGAAGYTPRYHEDMVRKLFISCAIMYMEEFKVDGFRFHKTSSIHNGNKLNHNGQIVSPVNAFGAKFLREINRTLKLLNRDIVLIAEDHSYWDKITKPIDFNNENDEAIGFDAEWSDTFYHNLIGDTKYNSRTYARLLYEAGFGESWPLKMDIFAYQALARSTCNKIVFHESHAEKESENTPPSLRTMEVAAHNNLSASQPETAEARCRFAAGMSLLSAGIPMFFMLEEVGAREKYNHIHLMKQREDYRKMKEEEGKQLFRFYRDLILLRKSEKPLLSDNIEILHVHNENRVLAFKRRDESEELLIIGSLNNLPFDKGYKIYNPSIYGSFREIFNSDAEMYGGTGLLNPGLLITEEHILEIMLPANCFIVLRQEEYV